ncbi:hypothetical protein [Streptomyces sp. NPDC049906]
MSWAARVQRGAPHAPPRGAVEVNDMVLDSATYVWEYDFGA